VITEITDRIAKQPWVEMWTLAIGVFIVCKILTLRLAPAWNPAAAAYILGYPGMNAREFLTQSSSRLPEGYLVPAIANAAAGAALLWTICPKITNPVVVGALGMIGFVLLAHFGVLQLLCLLWMRFGYAAEPLMDRPFQSNSLAEFWGRRWNLAF